MGLTVWSSVGGFGNGKPLKKCWRTYGRLDDIGIEALGPKVGCPLRTRSIERSTGREAYNSISVLNKVKFSLFKSRPVQKDIQWVLSMKPHVENSRGSPTIKWHFENIGKQCEFARFLYTISVYDSCMRFPFLIPVYADRRKC